MPELSLPTEEILEGIPDARCFITAQSADKAASAGFWACDVGRYKFYFGYDEFVYLVKGEVVVTECQPGGREFTMRPGDTAHFPQGVTVIWRVTRKMLKYFVARDPF